MPIIMFLLVVWVLKNAAMDVTYAANGKPNPRYEAKRIAATRNGQRIAPQPRYFTRDYFADFWSDRLAEKTRLRRERAAQPRQVEPVDVPTPQPVQPTPIPAPPVPAQPRMMRPAEPPVEDQLIALEDPAVAEEAPAAPARLSLVPPMKEHIVSVAPGEVIGLSQSIAYATDLAKHAADHGSALNEGYIGHLVTSKVTGACLASAHEMQAAQDNARAAAEAHALELSKQTVVKESYDTNPDAGSQEYLQQGE